MAVVDETRRQFAAVDRAEAEYFTP